MIPRPSLFSLVLATALLQSAWASASAFGGCYDTSSLDLESNGNITTTAECSALCAEGDYTLSLFSSMWNSSSCTCSSVSPASTALIPALAGAKDPSCSSEATTATLLSPGWTFDSCSYASSTTAQFASASNSSSACLDACAGYPYTYVFPTVSGWNCYCAMSGGGAGQTACADNTFYAYAAVKEEARRSRL